MDQYNNLLQAIHKVFMITTAYLICLPITETSCIFLFSYFSVQPHPNLINPVPIPRKKHGIIQIFAVPLNDRVYLWILLIFRSTFIFTVPSVDWMTHFFLLQVVSSFFRTALKQIQSSSLSAAIIAIRVKKQVIDTILLKIPTRLFLHEVDVIMSIKNPQLITGIECLAQRKWKQLDSFTLKCAGN